MTKQRVEFTVEMELAEGQNIDGWSDSVLLAVEGIAPKKEGRVIGGIGIQRLCSGARHDPRGTKHATFSYCGDCGWIDEASGP